ncbi:hypothetical protein M9435_000445 [Picochlorum sp. BPE23]|nr:hypothetical protein M9435_000445 [Picochlorum sp. BPE23]
MPVVRKVRLRHVCGDLGPFDVESTARVETLAEQAYKEWPKEGPMAVDPPLSPEEVGCIVQGKILSGSQDVESVYERYFGGYEEEQEEDVVMTMHVVVRPPKPPSKHRSKKKSQRGSRSRQQGGVTTSPSSSGSQCCVVM